MALDNEQYLRQLQREYLDFLDDDVSRGLLIFGSNPACSLAVRKSLSRTW